MNLFSNLATISFTFDSYGVVNEFMFPATRHESDSPVINYVLKRVLLDTEDDDDEQSFSEERLYNDAMRSLRFLTFFSIFATAFCSLSFYIYTRPYDGPNGSSIVSKIRKLPFFGWFFRQPQDAIEKQSQSSETVRLTEADQDNQHNDPNDVELGKLQTDGSRASSIAGKGDGEKTEASSVASVSTAAASRSRIVLFNSPNLTLFLCAIGLLVAYLTWAFMQERIMSHPYGDGDDESNWFKSSEFCVLINRFFGLLVSTVALRFTKPSGKDAPPFVISLCALSNMSSSWFQYESLHFVTFPVQTIFKSSKILITMAVGKIVQKKQYPLRKYLTACAVAVGVYVFLDGQRKIDNENSNNDDDNDLGLYFYLGLILICGYAFCDAFTSNWQSRVFDQSGISPLEMMQAVNAFTFIVSLCFCLSDLGNILQFYIIHPLIITHSLIMGLCAGFGQVIIFYTISTFGAVKFATVMTTRMVISVLISIVYYQHPMSNQGIVGMLITFAALFYQVYDKSKGKGPAKK